MADGWLYDRDGSDTLRVPFVFIPEGASQPTAWLIEHPNHIRVPAMFVPAKQSPRIGAQAPRSGGQVGHSSADDAATKPEPLPTYAPIGSRRGRRFPPPAQIDRFGYFQENPVATYLLINQAFDRLGVGSSPRLEDRSRMAASVTDPRASPQPAPDVPSHSDTIAGGTPDAGSTAHPTSLVELLVVKGKHVNSHQKGETMLRP
ncbi:MAG: hypothetical protein ACREF3_01760, partial [Acetobacteraceae bacterium]